jgi:rhodanese-related sulfurtransferase
MSEDEFVALITEGQPVAPAYFSFDASRNREARPLLDEDAPPRSMDLDEVLGAYRDGAVLLDTREPADFARGHLRGAVNVGLQGRFAEYAGDVLAPDQPIVLVGDPATALEARVRLGRIGFDRVLGHLALDDPAAAFTTRPDLAEPSSRITAAALRDRLGAGGETVLVDVRGPGEVEATGSIPGARVVPLAGLVAAAGDLDRGATTVVYCATGYRSSVAASLLRARGFTDVSDLLGGYEAWTRTSDAAPAAS